MVAPSTAQYPVLDNGWLSWSPNNERALKIKAFHRFIVQSASSMSYQEIKTAKEQTKLHYQALDTSNANRSILKACSEILSSHKKQLKDPETWQFEEDIEEWLLSPLTSGDKEAAARRLRHAYRTREPVLSLKGLGLTRLPGCLSKLNHLTEIDLSDNELTTFDPTTLESHKLITLNLSNNRLVQSSEWTLRLPNLKQLHLQNNRMTVFRVNFYSSTSLNHLDLSHNQLAEFPLFRGAPLKHLETLLLNSNQLTAIVDEISQLTGLKMLNLGDNGIETSNNLFEDLRKLQVLDIHNNAFSQLPFFGRELKSLIAYGNRIEEVPVREMPLQNLQNLDLSNNALIQVRPEINTAWYLSSLNLSGNPNLKSVPISLGTMNALKKCELQGTLVSESIQVALAEILNCGDDVLRNLKLILKLWALHTSQGTRDQLDLDFIQNFSPSEAATIITWLDRLSKTEMCIGNQTTLAEMTCLILNSLKEDPEFQQLFFDQVEANNTDCHDRASIGFNELYVAWRLHTIESATSTSEKIKILEGVAKTITLRNVLTNTYHIYDRNENSEIYLYYEIELKERLGLITPIESMRYTGLGDGCLPMASIVRRVKSQYVETLLKIPATLSLASTDPRFRRADSQAKKAWIKALADLEERKRHLNSWEYVTKTENAKRTFETTTKNNLLQWFRRCRQANPQGGFKRKRR